MTITVTYSSIDHFRKTRSFKTIEGARKFAIRCVGTPDIGSHYAVSFDGIGKITVEGCTLRELFLGKKLAEILPFEVWTLIVDEDRGTSRSAKDPNGAFATLREANVYAQHLDDYCDGVRIVGTTDEAKAEIAAQNERCRAQCFMDEHSPF